MITLLLLPLAVDSAFAQRRIPVAPQETLTVTIARPAAADSTAPAAARPVILLPGIIGASFGYRCRRGRAARLTDLRLPRGQRPRLRRVRARGAP